MPFYGESYQLDQSTLDTAAIRFHFDGLSETVAAGESFLVAAASDPVGLTDADTAVVSWVVETGPGSSGTFTVTSGLDPDYSMTPAVITEALGTFTAAGTQTIASRPASISVAALLAGDEEPTARIDVTSGSIEVLQVKLRVWPPGGAAGAWVTGDAWVRSEAQVDRWYASLAEGTPQLPTYAEAWEAQKAAIATWDGRPGTEYSTSPGGQSVRSFFQVFDNQLTAPFTPSGSAGASIALLSPRVQGAEPDPSIDYGIDPNEVRQERRSRIRALGGGEAVAEFVGWDDAATITVTNAHLGSIDLGSAPDLTVHPTNRDWRVGPFRHPSAFALRDGAVRLSELGGRYLALAVMAPGYFTGPPTADDFTSASGALAPSLPFLTRVANYEWFDPALAPLPARAPRFFVTYSEVDDDPRDVSHVVGIGKPADDLSVFRVPTPLGTLRELRHGEKVSDVSVCYPLKVKLEDGSWTIVAGMTPDR